MLQSYNIKNQTHTRPNYTNTLAPPVSSFAIIFSGVISSLNLSVQIYTFWLTITFTISLKRTLTSRNDRYLVNCPSSFTKITSWSVIPWKLISSHHPGISSYWKSHWFPKDRKRLKIKLVEDYIVTLIMLDKLKWPRTCGNWNELCLWHHYWLFCNRSFPRN